MFGIVSAKGPRDQNRAKAQQAKQGGGTLLALRHEREKRQSRGASALQPRAATHPHHRARRQGALKAVPDPNLRNWSAHLIDGRKRQWRVTSRPPLSRRRSRPPASSSGWKTSGASAWRPTYGADAPRTEDRGRRPNAEDTARLIGTGSKSASTPSAPRSTPRSLVCGDTPSANRYWLDLFDFSMCAVIAHPCLPQIRR